MGPSGRGDASLFLKRLEPRLAWSAVLLRLELILVGGGMNHGLFSRSSQLGLGCVFTETLENSLAVQRLEHHALTLWLGVQSLVGELGSLKLRTKGIKETPAPQGSV